MQNYPQQGQRYFILVKINYQPKYREHHEIVYINQKNFKYVRQTITFKRLISKRLSSLLINFQELVVWVFKSAWRNGRFCRSDCSVMEVPRVMTGWCPVPYSGIRGISLTAWFLIKHGLSSFLLIFEDMVFFWRLFYCLR